MINKRIFLQAVAAAAMATAGMGSAIAADITGAGATFPFPIYAKWAEAYKAQTGTGLNYQSIGSSGGLRQIRAKTVASAHPTRLCPVPTSTRTAWSSSRPSSAAPCP